MAKESHISRDTALLGLIPAKTDGKMKPTSILLTASILEFAAARIYTGFNYGAFWSEQSNVKRYADFHHGFELAQNLTNTPVHFDSARLYTCITAGTKNDPTEAFQAAIDTGTNLLLGMWVSPGPTGQPNEVQVDNELAALGKAFEKYGQSLADLIIGLSVGNEDVYRFTNQQAGKPGVGPGNLRLTIQRVREKIKAAPWGKFMEGKPIGHTDTSANAVMSDSDFIGMTAYPYWEEKSIDEANATFMAILKDTQKRAGNTPVWISEVGWPINGNSTGEAVASADNYQRYWNEVGCQVFGKYNTFWFELLQDSEPEQPGFGLLDTKTYQPRIKDLSCIGGSNMTLPASDNPQDASSAPSSKLVPTTLSTIYISDSASVSGVSSSPTSAALVPVSQTRTIHATQTRTSTVQPTSSPPNAFGNEITIFLTTTTYVSAAPTTNAKMPSNNGTASDDKTTACIVMMDLMGDGTFTPVATYAEDVSTCTPPPRFTDLPFTTIAGPTAAPAATEQKSSFDVYAPSTTSKPLTASTFIQSDGPTCMTAAGVAYEVVISNGETHTRRSTLSCPSSEPSTSAPAATASNSVKSSTLTAVSASASPSSSTFSYSLGWGMFQSHSTSPPPATITLPPSALSVATTGSLCPDGAIVCVTATSGALWAEITSGHANIVTRDGKPVPCSTTNMCTWTPGPAPTPSSICAKEGDMICLRTGFQAVIKDAIPHVVEPKMSCTPPAMQVNACPPAATAPAPTAAYAPPVSAPVGVPPTQGIEAVLSNLSEASAVFKHTTWASPLSLSSLAPASPPATTPTATAHATTSIRRSPSPAVPHEPIERRGGKSAVDRSTTTAGKEGGVWGPGWLR